LKQFQTAQKYCKAFLEIEPNNQQVVQLDVSILFPLCQLTIFNNFPLPFFLFFQEYVKKQLEREMMKGAAVAGAGVLLAGGLLGLGFALAKK
jgi:fission 1 protein